MEILEQIKAEFAAFEEKKNQLTEQLRGDFPKILAPLFEKHPSILSIHWRQYTPYFNDGDECVFGTTIDDLEVNGEGYVPKGLKQAAKEFSKVLGEIPAEMLKDVFGDHVEVTITREGVVETEEYKHD